MDLKELDKLIALCRKRGVEHIEYEGVTLTLSQDTPVSPYKRRQAKKKTSLPHNKPTADSGDDSIDTDEPSPEDLLFWSVGAGIPVDTNAE